MKRLRQLACEPVKQEVVPEALVFDVDIGVLAVGLPKLQLPRILCQGRD